ncbi:MAG: hypothetical protein OEZ06_15245 [Myxococcales bacterium]|nr:hypothetical protein [Myxococcales bacterium]
MGRRRSASAPKPLVKAVRLRLQGSRGPLLAIGPGLEEAIFHSAEILSEGATRRDAEGEVYFGSTMISAPLARLLCGQGGRLDPQQQQALQRAAEGSPRLRLRAMRLACAEASRRITDRGLGTALCEIQVRLDAEQLHIDVDLELPLGVLSASRQS